MSEFLPQFITDGVAFEIVKRLATPLAEWIAVSVGFHVFLKYVLHKLKKRQEVIGLWVASFLVVVVGGVFYANSDHAFAPKLQGFLLNGVIGNLIVDTTKPPDPAKPVSTIAIVVGAIVNSGTTQTIASNFRLSIKNQGNTYQGDIAALPETLVMGSSAAKSLGGVRFYGKDALYAKAATPIPSGGAIYGILAFNFPNIDWHMFQGTIEFTLSFTDAFGNNYSVVDLRPIIDKEKIEWRVYPGVQIDTIPKEELLSMFPNENNESKPK